MAHYKKDAASNRDALFGGGGGGGAPSSRSSRTAGGTRPASQRQRPAASSSSASARPAATSATAAAAKTSNPFNSSSSASSHSVSSLPSNNVDNGVTPGPSSIFNSSARMASRSAPLSVLTGQAKIAKMAEAEDYRLKAKKAMTRGIFSKPDPISAGNFYKRAADAYKACGENRLERLHRIASGDCQLGQDAYATAAAEYSRAAELAETSDEVLGRKRQECHKLHLDAANAWTQMGERGRAAESTMKAAFGLVMGQPCNAKMEPNAIKAVEEAVETFVGDPLNKKKDYRRTGKSAYQDDSNANNANANSSSSLELAKQNIITDSFAHEIIFQCSNELLRRRHYESALYAHGAGTAALEHEGYATVSLSRAYLSETIILLAMGDAVAANRDFTTVHLQRTSYLTSRECALEEDLIRAISDFDAEELENVRGKGGKHRAALANLDPMLRQLVLEIKVSGRANKKEVLKKKKKAPPPPPAAARKPAPPPPTKKDMSGEELAKDTDAGFAEMDDIMNQLGLGDDEDGDGGGGGGDDSDSDIDLT
mmetsp:Transcript_33233/g.56495  ORF Transcript_33233/g.56495 Transcript_33233/m.56495 type:complete len:540 (+) Transcript_33233:49-1668(+)|eukprot:CAMPEP_0183704122 /NCGR_PEP_ID=MMETSP0737-20130205/1571_1 /TAXON_ID=385413 /ORGANISM="Thalassiosira miniscula, Strain CCMP1093" /LENGTH=539 /DNA_ID=CAMNT_0025930943 /DNA_START=34 /DNA_END=1653 /DNA_ORIENTATION=-